MCRGALLAAGNVDYDLQITGGGPEQGAAHGRQPSLVHSSLLTFKFPAADWSLLEGGPDEIYSHDRPIDH